MGEGDGDVGEDDGDDDGPWWHSDATGSKGERAPFFFFFFFLDLLPRWEKGFPSGPWPPWHGRGESPSEIGSVSLSLSVSVFSSGSVSPFRIYMEIRNSDWPETFVVIFFEYQLSCGKRRASTALRVAHESPGRAQGGGRAPLSHGHPGHRFTLILPPENPKYSKIILRPFLSHLDSV